MLPLNRTASLLVTVAHSPAGIHGQYQPLNRASSLLVTVAHSPAGIHGQYQPLNRASSLLVTVANTQQEYMDSTKHRSGLARSQTPCPGWHISQRQTTDVAYAHISVTSLRCLPKEIEFSDKFLTFDTWVWRHTKVKRGTMTDVHLLELV